MSTQRQTARRVVDSAICRQYLPQYRTDTGGDLDGAHGGGVGQIQDITEALSTAFDGRADDLRSLINQLDEYVATSTTRRTTSWPPQRV
jgi:ABC-type transporter Mla subunit MlaD